MIDRISSLFLVRCRISIASLSYMRTMILSEMRHPSIPDLTARSRKLSSCVLGMTMTDSSNFLMAKSSIWCIILSDSTNVLCAWELFMGLQV